MVVFIKVSVSSLIEWSEEISKLSRIVQKSLGYEPENTHLRKKTNNKYFIAAFSESKQACDSGTISQGMALGLQECLPYNSKGTTHVMYAAKLSGVKYNLTTSLFRDNKCTKVAAPSSTFSFPAMCGPFAGRYISVGTVYELCQNYI